jgi:hypothetical protein
LNLILCSNTDGNGRKCQCHLTQTCLLTEEICSSFEARWESTGNNECWYISCFLLCTAESKSRLISPTP